MRLSAAHKTIITQMESEGYVWLSHMPVNAQMRFRNRTRAGFKQYVKREGLTFLTHEVADLLSMGTKRASKPRIPCNEQLDIAMRKLHELSLRNMRLEAIIKGMMWNTTTSKVIVAHTQDCPELRRLLKELNVHIGGPQI